MSEYESPVVQAAYEAELAKQMADLERRRGVLEPAEVDRVSDRIAELTEEQRQRVLWRLIYRNPGMVDAVIDEFESTSWEWGR